MKIQKTIARKVIFPIALKFRLDKLLRNRAENSILHVMYHGVVEKDSCYFSPRHITKEQFEQHLKYFKKNFEILTTDEAIAKINNKEKIDKKYIAISFDDGFQNNLKTAVPLLEKYDIPTTFYISSICLDKNEKKYLWSETVSALKYFCPDQVVELDGRTFKNLICTKDEMHLADFIKTLPYDKRDDILNQLESKYDLRSKMESLPEEIWKLMTKEELLEMAKSPIVTIGSHGHRHFNLSEIQPEFAELELKTSRELLSQTLNTDVSLIAYPDGSYNETVKDLAEKNGYTGQFAVSYKSPKDSADTRISNRHGISSTTTFESNMLSLNLAFKTKGIN